MADLLVHAKTVWTFDRAKPKAQAVGIRDGRILCVGNVFEVRESLTRPLELDLEDATVVPGLTDAHGHLVMLGRAAHEVELAAARSAEEVAALVAERAGQVPKGQWIRGQGWDQNRFPGGAFPDRTALDAAVPSHPVLLERVDGHAALVNAAALAVAGITKGSGGDPPGGQILRDELGEPTGVLVDTAMELVLRHLPPPSATELEQLLAEAARRCAAAGLVGVHDAGVDLDVVEALRRLDERGELPIRVYAMARAGGPRFAEILQAGPSSKGLVTVKAIKFFLDGALGSRGAALFQEYADAPGERGLITAPEPFAETLAELMQLGFQPSLHAIGDRANALALDALETAQQASQRTDLRPRIEHVQVLRPGDLRRFAPLGAVASVQPIHAISDRPWAQARLGAERLLESGYLWKSLAEAGARLAFGSDFPIEPPNPLRGLWAACTRHGWPTTAECLERTAAIEAFTTGAAWASFEEAETGRIVPGMRADLTAFDRDIVTEPPEALLETEVELVMVGGKATFSD